MAHDPVSIHDDNGPAAVPFVVPPEAILFRHLTLWMKVGQQRILQPAENIGEGAMRVDAVYTEAQNLDLELLEPEKVFLE